MKTAWRKNSVSSVLLYAMHVILSSGKKTSKEKKGSQQSSVVSPVTPETSGKLSKKGGCCLAHDQLYFPSYVIKILQVFKKKIFPAVNL